ncbi:MAG: acylphosphatase [Rhodospirillales bacterium]|nr:MAG: acylphosphatase [Rhodospirillales bacterium]
MTSPPRVVTVRVRGIVQGVGFREWTARRARALGLDGWVRNRRDGGVEAALSGAPAAVDAMIAACRAGPPSARVDGVEVADGAVEVAAGFTRRDTA